MIHCFSCLVFFSELSSIVYENIFSSLCYKCTLFLSLNYLPTNSHNIKQVHILGSNFTYLLTTSLCRHLQLHPTTSQPKIWICPLNIYFKKLKNIWRNNFFSVKPNTSSRVFIHYIGQKKITTKLSVVKKLFLQTVGYTKIFCPQKLIKFYI